MVVVRHERNQGKGAALATRLRRGDRRRWSSSRTPTSSTTRREYPKLVRPILDGKADVVYGSRFVGGDSHRVLYFWHSVGNRVLTLLSNMFTNLNLTDMETCYKVFRREIIQSITLEEDRFGFEPEITAKVAALPDCRIYEVGISYSGRTYAEGKKIGWRDGVRADVVHLEVPQSMVWSSEGRRAGQSQTPRPRELSAQTIRGRGSRRLGAYRPAKGRVNPHARKPRKSVRYRDGATRSD